MKIARVLLASLPVPLVWTIIATWFQLLPTWPNLAGSLDHQFWLLPTSIATGWCAWAAAIAGWLFPSRAADDVRRRLLYWAAVVLIAAAPAYVVVYSMFTYQLPRTGRIVITTWQLNPDLERNGEPSIDSLFALTSDPDELFSPAALAISRLMFLVLWVAVSGSLMFLCGWALERLASSIGRRVQPVEQVPSPPPGLASAPSVSTTLAIVLASWDFPHMPQFRNSPLNGAFERSSGAIRQYLTTWLRLPEENILLLGNAALLPPQIRFEIEAFLKSRAAGMADLLFFFTGHAYVDEPSRVYRLVTSAARQDDPETALSFPSLLDVFKRHAAELHWHLFIDACYAGQALSAANAVWCPRGWTLFTAADSHDTARTEEAACWTVFTQELLRVLCPADGKEREELARLGQRLTCRNIDDMLQALPRERQASVPQFHRRVTASGDPAQRELFPNPLASRLKPS
jgi:hypothetical protein